MTARTRDPVWLVLLGYALAALAVGVGGWLFIRGFALCVVEALRRLA